MKKIIYVFVTVVMAVAFFTGYDDMKSTEAAAYESDFGVNQTTAALSESDDTTNTIATPTLNKTTAANGGIKVSWDSVSNASGYVVYRKTSSSSWSVMGHTTSTSYTDTTAKTGTTYYYTVRAYKGSYATAKSNKYKSKYWSDRDSTGVKGKYLKSPTLKSAKATASGTTVTWSEVTNASGYVVYRKVSGGSWKRIGTTTSTSYTDKEALTSGKTYYYRVRSYSGSLKTADANSNSSLYWSYTKETGLKNVYLSKPTLKSVSQLTSGGVKVSWSKVSGASGYVIYRKTSSGSWKIIGKSTSTNYTDKSSLTTGTTYYYTVRAYRGSYSTAVGNKYNAAYWGGYNSTGLSVKYIDMTAYTYAEEVAELVNEQRTANGLSELTLDETLTEAAMERAKECAEYFSHTRPDGTTCFTILSEYGITYYAAGENIAGGFSSSSSVMQAWMNSSGHKANILSSSYNKIGVGYYQGYWVQIFIYN